MLALSFVLAIASLVSFIMVRSISSKSIMIGIDRERVRGFKGDRFEATLSMIIRHRAWVSIGLSSIAAQEGVDVKWKALGGGITRLFLKPRYAGCFSGLVINFESKDILGLFSNKVQSVHLDFIIESLPMSILTLVPTARPMPLTLGDKASRSRGSNLELYALDNYQPFTETKNLLWKRIARMPDEKLIVRIREASIPRVVRIGLVESAFRTSLERAEFVDLVCEGIGTLGNYLIAIGCRLAVLRAADDGTVESSDASSVQELSDVLMKVSDASKIETKDKVLEVLGESDVIVSGLLELEEDTLARSIARMPSLLIFESKARPLLVGEKSVIYSGMESLQKIVSQVVEK